jgi:hypothetical protein
MSLLLAGALGGIGSGLFKQGELQQAEEASSASELRKAIMQSELEDRRDAREEAKLKSAEAIADKRYNFEEKLLAQKESTDERKLQQQADLANQRYGLMLEGLRLKANAPRGGSGGKQSNIDEKVELAASLSGLTNSEMNGLLSTADKGQFMTTEAAMDAMKAAPNGVLTPDSYHDFLLRNSAALDRGYAALAGATPTEIRRIGETGKQAPNLEAQQAKENSAAIKAIKEKKALWADKADPVKNRDVVSRQEAQKKIAQYNNDLMQLIDPPNPVLTPDDAAKALGFGDGVLPRGN